MFRRSLSLIAEKGKRAVNESPNFDAEDEACEPEHARLRMQPSVISEISAGVHDYVRRNSKLN